MKKNRGKRRHLTTVVVAGVAIVASAVTFAFFTGIEEATAKIKNEAAGALSLIIGAAFSALAIAVIRFCFDTPDTDKNGSDGSMSQVLEERPEPGTEPETPADQSPDPAYVALRKWADEEATPFIDYAKKRIDTLEQRNGNIFQRLTQAAVEGQVRLAIFITLILAAIASAFASFLFPVDEGQAGHVFALVCGFGVTGVIVGVICAGRMKRAAMKAIPGAFSIGFRGAFLANLCSLLISVPYLSDDWFSWMQPPVEERVEISEIAESLKKLEKPEGKGTESEVVLQAVKSLSDHIDRRQEISIGEVDLGIIIFLLRLLLLPVVTAMGFWFGWVLSKKG